MTCVRGSSGQFGSRIVNRLNGCNMEQYESNTHPFIVKIWIEEPPDESGGAKWRGHITHVPSGEQRYLKDLDGITTFIAPYLESMGVKLPTRGRIRRWFKRS